MSPEGRRGISRIELRREFPDLPFDQFNEIIDTLGLGEPEALRIILREENDKAGLEREERERRLRERFETITASMLHRKLEIPVRLPPEMDREQLCAFLVYGFVVPSSTKRFVGSNYLPREYIRKDVRNKFGPLFEEDKFQTVEAYALRNGVIQQSKRGAQGFVAYSLNIAEGAKGVTHDGRAIIIAVKRFMHEHRPNHGPK